MEYRKGATDKVIRSLQLSGPAHESRLVLRAKLLSTLLSAVPKEAVHYNHRVIRAWTDAECALPCKPVAWPQDVVAWTWVNSGGDPKLDVAHCTPSS